MRQHYTQSTASRNLNIPAIARLTDEQAFDLLTQIRFADSGGKPYCPNASTGAKYAGDLIAAGFVAAVAARSA